MLDVQIVVYYRILCRHCAGERAVLRTYVTSERAVDRADVAVSTDVAGRVDGSGNIDITVDIKRAVKVGGSVDFEAAGFERAKLAETSRGHSPVFYHGVVARLSDFNLRLERTVCSGEVAGYIGFVGCKACLLYTSRCV